MSIMASMRSFTWMLFVLLPLCAQPPQEAPKKGGGAPQAHKNLKVLKDDEVRPAMMLFTRSLGVRCDYCHVQDRSSDENPKKVTARMMITMAHDINARFPDGKVYVTCYTCHRGKAMPETDPPAPTPPPGQ
jgi:Photosynthetic reaction centre cytochrome C subunit